VVHPVADLRRLKSSVVCWQLSQAAFQDQYDQSELYLPVRGRLVLLLSLVMSMRQQYLSRYYQGQLQNFQQPVESAYLAAQKHVKEISPLIHAGLGRGILTSCQGS
jgi:hypothetical protein